MAAGKPCPAFPNVGVVPIRKADNKIMDIGIFGSFDDFLHGCIRLPIGDVLPDGAAEHIDVLLDNPNRAAQAFEG